MNEILCRILEWVEAADRYITKKPFSVYMGTTFILAIVVMVLVLSGCASTVAETSRYGSGGLILIRFRAIYIMDRGTVYNPFTGLYEEDYGQVYTDKKEEDDE